MSAHETALQNEFNDLLKAHFARRKASGNNRSKWPVEIVSKFGELFRAGHSAGFFEETFGLKVYQYHSLRLRLQPKPVEKDKFRQVKVQKHSSASIASVGGTGSSALYLRSQLGVELRGIQSLQEAVELFVKVSR